jgi:hypothetical protein
LSAEQILTHLRIHTLRELKCDMSYGSRLVLADMKSWLFVAFSGDMPNEVLKWVGTKRMALGEGAHCAQFCVRQALNGCVDMRTGRAAICGR